MYENEQIPGCFSRRWGDQGPFAKFVGMWYNLTDAQYKGVWPANWSDSQTFGSAVCDFTYMRNNHFVRDD